MLFRRSRNGLNFSKTKKFQKDFSSFIGALDQFHGNFLLDQSGTVLRETISKTPVDTGDLKKSWEMSGLKKTENGYMVRIKNKMNYASWVEEGHMTVGINPRWIVGRFMHKAALLNMDRRFKRDYDKGFKKLTKIYGVSK